MKRLALLFALLLGACGKNMVQQARYDEYEEAPLFPHNMAMRPPPAGTVARDAFARAAATRRPEMNLALVQRGRERFNIYCAPCHGYDGSGNGVVPARGFPHPPDFHSTRLKSTPSSHFYDVITNGFGVMPDYRAQIAPRDRWAIVAYIRALQYSQHAAASDVPGGDPTKVPQQPAGGGEHAPGKN